MATTDPLKTAEIKQEISEKTPLEPNTDTVKVPSTEELTDMLRRLQAEFENYRKRTEKQQAEFTKFANKAMLLEILPILDHFNLALGNTSNHKEFVKGVEMIYSQMIDVLHAQGVERIETQGNFNPAFHEALLQEEGKGTAGLILEELQVGYTLGGQVLRPSKVKIAK